MRILRIVLILAVLIGFPAFSWYYLKSGYRWRVSAQEETQRIAQFDAFSLRTPDKTILTAEHLKGTYYLVATPLHPVSLEHLDKVHAQFKAREDFRMICLVCGVGDVLKPEGAAWIYAECASGCEPLYGTWFGGGFDAAIVDDSLYVRGRYHLSDPDEVRKLIEHLAVVLPIEKRERIQLKRGEQSR